MPKLSKKKLQEAQEIAALERYVKMAHDVGVQRDQIQRFIQAGVFLQKKQLMFCAAARECDSPDGPNAVGYGGGRGSAKSHGVFAQMALDDSQRFEGLKFLYLRKIGKTNKEQFDDIRKKILSNVPHHYAEQKGLLTFERTQSQIRLAHFKNESDIDAYLGVEYDGMILEECTQLTFTKWKNILSCLRTSKPGWRPRVYSPTNPGGVGTGWFKSVFVEPWQRNTQRETRYIHTTVHDNAFVNKEYLQYLESLTGWQREAWLHGSWELAQGQFFVTFRTSGKDCHVLDSIDETHARKWVVGMDAGWQHYTVFLLGFIDNGGRLFVVEEYGKRHTTPQEHAANYFAMLARHRIHPALVTQIAAGPDIFRHESTGRTIAETYRNLGMRITCCETDRVNGWAEVTKRMGDPDNGIKPTMFIHRKCKRLIEQIPLMCHNVNKPEDLEKVDIDEEGNGGDDFVDGLRELAVANPDFGVLTNAIALPVCGYTSIGA